MEWVSNAASDERDEVRAPIRGLLLLGVAALVALGAASPVLALDRPGAQPSSNRWLAVVNYYRATAGLPRVSEDEQLSRAAQKHAEYMVRNDVVTHTENPGDPFFSVLGNEAGTHSNVAGWWGSEATDRDFVEMWMVGPFHAVGILRPNLEKVGYGVARDNRGLTAAAALDVIHGLDHSSGGGTDHPVVWPATGTTQPLNNYYGGEYPDPLSSCRGYSAPAGLPIVIQFESEVRNVTYSFSRAGNRLPACEVDARNYRNPNASAQSLGRQLLDGDNVVVVIPKEPLEAGKTYVVKVTSGSETARSRFSISR